MTNKLICLVGKSGSGKTTLTKSLENSGFNIIHSYTTRKKRHEDEWGHIFVNECDCFLEDGKLKDNIIAYTFYNNNHYWATSEQIIGNTIYVVDPIGIIDLKEAIKNIPLYSVYLKCDDDVLHNRMKIRFDDENSIKQRLEYDKVSFKNVENYCDFIIDSNKDISSVNKDFLTILNHL